MNRHFSGQVGNLWYLDTSLNFRNVDRERCNFIRFFSVILILFQQRAILLYRHSTSACGRNNRFRSLLYMRPPCIDVLSGLPGKNFAITQMQAQGTTTSIVRTNRRNRLAVQIAGRRRV